MSQDQAEGSLADVARAVAELKDLFVRRLFEDKDKRRLIDSLLTQLDAERNPFRQHLHPAVREIALVIDRADDYEGPDPQFAGSVRDELIELLERLGVLQVQTDGLFDPARHEMAATVQDLSRPDRDIVRVLARGFAHGDWLFRPARVVVNLLPSDLVA